MISFFMNGNKTSLEETTTLQELINNHNISNNNFAICLNQQVINRTDWQSYIIKENDTIEIIIASPGG